MNIITDLPAAIPAPDDPYFIMAISQHMANIIGEQMISIEEINEFIPPEFTQQYAAGDEPIILDNEEDNNEEDNNEEDDNEEYVTDDDSDYDENSEEYETDDEDANIKEYETDDEDTENFDLTNINNFDIFDDNGSINSEDEEFLIQLFTEEDNKIIANVA